MAKTSWEMIVALLIFFGASLAVYVHLYFGISVGDESFYAVTALLPVLGGKWYRTELLFQQTAGMLYAPILFGYRALFGLTGVLLFLRHLEFIFSLLVAHQVYLTLKIFNRPATALTLSALTVAFVPHALSTLSYNTIGSLLFALACSLSARSYLQRSPRLAALAGVAWTLDVFAYPTLIMSALAFSGAAALLAYRDRSSRRKFLWPLISGGLISALPLVLGLYLLGFDNLRTAAQFSAAYNHPGWWKIPFSLSLARSYFPPLWTCASWLVIYVILFQRLRDVSLVWLALGLAAFFVFGPGGETASVQVLLAVLPALGMLFWRRDLIPRERMAIMCIVVPSLVGAFVACTGSRATLYVMCVTGLTGSIFSLSIAIGRRRSAGLLCAAILVVGSAFQLWQQFYEDDSFTYLNYTFRDGPMAGLTTTSTKGQFIDAIQADLAGIRGKRIVFHDFFLLGYLMADNIPSGPTQYLGPAAFFPEMRAAYAKFFREANDPPDVVVELAYYPVKHDQSWNYLASDGPGGLSTYFADLGIYQILVQRPSHRILVRRP